MIKNFIDRVKINESNGCWEFTGALRNGYGTIKIKNKLYLAHRISWELNFGIIPIGLFVLHKCDNRKCVNPDHLFLGTQKDNMKDAFSKGRIKIPINKNNIMKKGYSSNNTDVPIELALKIKALVKNRKNTKLIEIAKNNGVKYQYVRDISRGRILQGI